MCTGEGQLAAHKRNKHDNKFPCDRCGLKLNTLPALDNHIRSNHEQQVIFSCEFCAFNTKVNGNLEKHLNIKHNIISSYPRRQPRHQQQSNDGRQQPHNNGRQNQHNDGRQQQQSDGRQQQNNEGRPKEVRGPYSDVERRNNGFCRYWNNSSCSFQFCKFLHEESPDCRYQEQCRHPSSCRFFHRKPQQAKTEFQYRQEDFPPFQPRN